MKRLVGLIVFTLVPAMLISGCVAAAPPVQQAPVTLPTTAPAPQVITSSSDTLALENAFSRIYEQVSPMVVKIFVTEPSTSSGGFGRLVPGTPQIQHGLGSGFIWDKSGNIVTNNHVVDGATSILVTFSDGTTVDAKVVGTDPDSDLAVIKVEAADALLQPVQVGDSSQIKVGQLVVAIGNPFGEQNTMTTGIVSAVGRSLPVDQSSSSQTAGQPSYQIPDVIQTDASINPGNSGGVLVDMQGRLLGVTAAIESSTNSSAGIGFAIPSSIVKRVVPSLIKTHSYQHAYLGISGMSLSPDLAKAMNLPATQRGALVGTVTAGGPSEKAGVKGSEQQVTIGGQKVTVGGDVIIAIDSQVVKEFDDVISYLASSTDVGQTVVLTVLRGGKQEKVSVTLSARPGTKPQARANGIIGAGWPGSLALSGQSQVAEAI